ncbi:MAG: CapA family protein [Ruminococcaceae bacterium]|nr:CapA family protein [Oscillospiraceae bacterium]
MKLLLCGDICPTSKNEALFASGDIKALFGDTTTLFEGNDLHFINLECALTEKETPITKIGPNLKSGTATAATLKALGVDVCGLSNNHVFDFGIPGVTDMLSVLAAQGIAMTGFGKNYEDARRDFVLEKHGERVTLIAVCEHEFSYATENGMGSRPFDEFDTLEDIRAAKAKGGTVVVLYHGGKEFCRYPSPRLLRACRAMARAGADVVLCQHSHCIGCYEEYEGCHILYGQGNFHFVGRKDDAYWHSGLSVKYDTATHAIEFVPHVMTEYGITLATGAEKAQLMADFAARNEELADGRWQEGWHAFCESKREAYVEVVRQAGTDDGGRAEKNDHMFAHYLDCEAHTDVWRELYKTAHHTNERS